MLLKADGPIHLFFRKCREVTVGDLKTAVSDMLNILLVFLRKRSRSRALRIYTKDLMAQCQRIATGKGHGTVKVLAIELLTRMVDKRDGFETTDEEAKAIYDKFMEQYTMSSVRPTAKQRIVELLGTIAKNYPQLVDGKEANSKLKRWCFQGLNHESKRHFADAELSLVTGYLTCIDILLYRQEEEEQMGISKEEAFVILQPQSPEVQQLFNHILIIITTSKDTNRYQAVIAALSLFKNHCEMFSKLLMDRYVNLYRELHYWATHYNSTCYKFGLGAFEEFLRQLSVVLFHNIHGDREKAIARDLVAQFGQTLLKADSLDSIYEVSVAIRGVGYFSKVFYALENEPDIKIDMYQWRNNLVRISNWFYSETNKNQKEYIRHLPAFIKAYASFAEVQDNIPVDLMQTLQLMCDIFILSFAEMSGYHRRNGSFYIQQLFSMIFNKNKGVFLQFIDGFFEKALICTCTNIHQPDKEDRPAYTELLYFWKVVLELMTDDTRVIKLEIDTQKEDAEIEADDIFKLYNQRTVITNPNELSRIMYDTFISTTLKLIKSFNLKLKNIALTEADLKMEESEQENIQILSKSLRPINQKDFVLFQNLVDFWCTLLKEIDNTYMIHWVHIISTQLIELSTIHQLVSGFYRILAEVLIICEQQNFFRGCKAYNDALKENVNINIEKGMPAEYSTYIIVQEFLKEVWHRLQQFTDELLASCLRLILAYPVEFFDIEELITPLEKALRLGITYHPLATIAMNSLDKLLDPTFRYEISSKFLSCILPCINEYLLVGVISFENDDSIGSSSNNKKKYKTPTASERRYRSVHLKMTSEQIGVIKRNYSSLPELQRRMMQFLGRLGGKNKQLLITQQEGQEQGQENENDNARILSWDTTKKIKLRIPFRTMKVDIYLDEYLPRICELAESSPDRKIKVAACELLHGLVVYMVGNSAFTPRKSKRSEESDYHKFYSRLFPVMLNLAIDADQVTRDMFRVLNSQVIHWLTNNAHYENPETIVLLHTLLDAACQTDAGLREYSAKCIQEFVEWSIKQTPRTTDSVHNIRSLLKRLYNLMASPNASKRFGAALVFNNMYRFFREEETLVNMYTFEILGQLFLNLKIAEVDHPSIGTREQIIEAINHIKRILRQKIDLFMTDNDRRPFIGSDEVVDLPSLVEWTFKESGSLQRTYAKVCINFFNEFAKLLPGIKETHQWLSNQDEKLIETVFLNKHLDLLSDTAPTVFVRQPDGEKDREKNIKATIDAYSNWIKQMNATVDGFVWLVERKIVSPQQLLIQSLSCSSRLFQVVREFFAKRPDTYLKGILEQSVSEKGTILSIYVYVVVRLIYFFDLIFNHDNECFEYATQHAADVLFHEILMNTVAETLLLPKQISERIQTYQGNAVTQSSTKRIYDIGKKYIITMTNKSCQKFEEYLVIAAANIIKSFNIDLISRTEGTTDRSLLIETVQSVDGIQFLQSIHLLEPVCKKMRSIVKNYPRDVQAYYTKLFEYFLTNCYGSQDPLQIQFMGKLVCICFGNEQFARNHAEALLAFSGPLTHLSDSEKLEMVRKYDDFFVESITRNFNVFSRIFKANITNTIVRDYLTLLFDYLMINRLRIRKSVWQITDYPTIQVS
ncbi:hypothetical protein BDF20DRAFT_642731 [Mycotypha africana]|uniref:uncharacterized protein n=1 Tax=Mycotypha africana TaxID=64632 RepID=UPI00230129B8|nr:uncharacterized protein BDF20DRAFT_642731 [Mycotypha africana]KAI8973301.1 hypothetical protein BDF20DRAFT_642731 [Mycotypha africana]